MPELPDENRDGNQDELDINMLRQVVQESGALLYTETDQMKAETDDDEEFWATFSMITHTGERFVITVCFASRQHYNNEMHKLEIAKNLHVVLKDVNEESVVIKRDMLLHVLPSTQMQAVEKKKNW